MKTITKEVIAKIADDNPQVMAGVEALLNEQIAFRSLRRALVLLRTAKNERYLQAVEAGLRVTIGEIKNYYFQGSPHMDGKKAALYLQTLQQLIDNLSKWEFANGKPNQFKPTLTPKLRFVDLKGAQPVPSANHLQIIQKIIEHLQDNLTIMELYLSYIQQNLPSINEIIGQYIGSADPQKISKIVAIITRHLADLPAAKTAKNNGRER